MTHRAETKNMALFCDFENVALGVQDANYAQFDIRKVIERLLLKGDRWLTYDILIENLSLISNYRSQFDRVIRTSSYAELVKRLQNRVDALQEKEDKAPKGTKPAPR